MKSVCLLKLNLLGMAVLVMLATPLWAAVKGDCVNCHTMHNSQDGKPMIFNLKTGKEGPMPTLLRSDCVGCHSNPTGSETIIMLGSSAVPIVYNPTGGLQYPPSGSSNSVLAGGNFYWVAAKGDAFGHNVFGIAGTDASHSAKGAPGGDRTMAAGSLCYNCHITLSSAGSGCGGCHLPAHHVDDGVARVADRGDGWYRFLGNVHYKTLDNAGVVGVEDAKWEQEPTSTQHNVYKGTTVHYGRDERLLYNSIGKFCSGCHSNFHHGIEPWEGIGVAGAWIRHPSDVVLPADPDKEYSGYTTYNPLAPVAKQTVDGTVSSSVVPGQDVVTCISCHRPHGSPYPDMLRWDYANDCNAGVADSATHPCGCFACHTSKDDI